jgi:hypothetical protein
MKECVYNSKFSLRRSDDDDADAEFFYFKQVVVTLNRQNIFKYIQI